MTDDEEKQLRRELLAADLELRRKQAFWETPRNLAILVGLTALIAAAIGFWLGRELGPRAPSLTPAYGLGGLDTPMTRFEFIDAVQTASLIVITALLAYVIVRLEQTLTMAIGELKKALTIQQALHQRITILWERVEMLEELRATQEAALPTPALKSTLDEIRRRLDKLERGVGSGKYPP